jgi:hypothetical protein
MQRLSPSLAHTQWEIWVFAPGDFRMPVQACGFYHTRGRAQQAAGQLSDWLHVGARPSHLLGSLDSESRREVLVMHDELAALGVDPAFCVVTVERVGPRLAACEGDNQRRAPWERDADCDLEDTALEPVSLTYERADPLTGEGASWGG